MLTMAVDPVFLRVGGFSIRWYGLLLAIAVGVGVYVSLQEAKRKGIAEDAIYTAAFWALLAGIVGARLFHILDQLNYYLLNPMAVLALQQGGLAIYGGLAGGVVAGVIYGLVRHLPVWRLADIAAPGLALAQATGRIGCIINGDAWGAPTNLPWSIVYIHNDAVLPRSLLGVPLHPAAVYELVWNLLVFGVLWKLRPRILHDGAVFITYIVLYSLGRFLITFIRQDEVVLLGLQQAQLVAVVAIIVGVPFLAYLTRRQAAFQKQKV